MLRKTISMTTFLSFILLCITSFVLYIVPEGRVAYWGNWTLLYMSKGQWGAMHITGGILFMVVSVWHILLNWKSIVRYLQASGVQALRMPLPLLSALLICLFVYGGTAADIQPMRQIMAWSQDIKAYQEKVHGKPPYGHAETSSLKKFCGFMGFDLETVLAYLQSQHLKGPLEAQTTILDLAKANDRTPQQVFEMIKSGVTAPARTGAGNKANAE